MNRLRSALKSFEGKDYLISLLEARAEEDAAHLAEAFLRILEEAQRRGQPSLPNGASKQLDVSSAIARLTSLTWAVPKGLFNVAVLKNGFALQPEGDSEEWIHIPFSAIQGIASIAVPLRDILESNEFKGTGITTDELSKTEGHLFINLHKNAGVLYRGKELQTLSMKSRNDISVAVHSVGALSDKMTGNEATILADLLRLAGVPEETFDSHSQDRPQNGAPYFSPVHEGKAGFLFLLEKSLCLGSDPSLCFPLKDIVTVGMRTYKSTHFALKLCTSGICSSHYLKFLPNAEKSTILRYFRRKNIPFCDVTDIHAMYQAMGHKVPDGTSGEEEKAADHQNPPASRSEAARSPQPPAIEKELSTGNEENEDRRPAEAFVFADGSNEISGADDAYTESDSIGTTTPDEAELLNLLVGEELPDRDDEDADYVPTASTNSPSSRTKRRRSTQTDENREGCLIRKRCQTDDDMELEEIDSDNST